MPVTRGPGVVVTPPTETPGRGSLPRQPDPGEYALTWITPPDRSGNTREILLNPPGQSFFTLKNITGLGVADRDITTSANPDGGSTVDAIRYTQRQLVIPIRIRDRQHTAFLTKWRDFGQALGMTARYGPGLIRIDRPNGTSRQIPALYASGWGNEPGDGAWIEDTCSVSLLCPDPWWRDTEPVAPGPFTIEPLVDYLDPYPSIGSGAVLGAVTITNPGQVDVWPAWTITGPMTALTAANNTRGQSFTLTYPLGVGETITMSSRPIQVRGPAGQNLTSALNLPTGKPWRLDAEWASDVTFTASGSGPTTKVALEFTPGYETA